jgi:sulfur-carrier protein
LQEVQSSQVPSGILVFARVARRHIVMMPHRPPSHDSKGVLRGIETTWLQRIVCSFSHHFLCDRSGGRKVVSERFFTFYNTSGTKQVSILSNVPELAPVNIHSFIHPSILSSFIVEASSFIMTIDIQVKFFASCRDLVGESAVVITAAISSTTDLVALLLEKYPDLQNGISEVSLAVNKQYIDGPCDLNHNDEVAFLPPMSGG